jgi:hypothetical protein
MPSNARTQCNNGAGSETLKELKQGGAFEIRAIVALANPGGAAKLERPQAPAFDVDVERRPATRAELRDLFNREQPVHSDRQDRVCCRFAGAPFSLSMSLPFHLTIRQRPFSLGTV